MRQLRLAFAALLVLSSLLGARPARAEEPVTTPHPALVVGVVNDVLAVVCLAAGTPFAAAKDSATGGALLGSALVYAISGIISTVHGVADHRELRCPACAAAGNVLTTTGATVTVAGIAMLAAYQTTRPLGGVLAVSSLALLAPGIPLLVYGELSAKPGSTTTKTEGRPRMNVVGGLGQVGLSGSF